MKEAAMIKSLWGKKWEMNNSKSIQDLKLDYIPYQQSLKEMVESMIAHGYLPDKISSKKK